MRQTLVLLVLAAVLNPACSPDPSPDPTVEIFVTPSAYVVATQSFVSPSDAARHALSLHPRVISVPSCAAMPTKRVTELVSALDARPTEVTLSLSVVPDGSRGCPSS